jgi:glycosyltransferase involved in cell wall biosynthesis
MSRQHFHALVTFAQPWPDHLIGLEVHRQTRIPWLAHFSDPWVDSPYIDKNDRRYPVWRSQEEAVVREAGAVVFTTPHTANLVMRKYADEYSKKVHVVPHGYDADFLKIIEPAPKNPRLRMVSIGNFYRARTPMPLLDALEQLNRTRSLGEELDVILAGGNNLSYGEISEKMGLGDVVTCRDAVPFLDGLRLSAGADVLVVIDAPSDGASVFLPSKLVDYLMFQKPILGITPLEGSSAELLRRAGCPVAAPGDVAGIAEAVRGLLERWRAGTLSVSPCFAEVAREYEITQTTRIFDRALRQLRN